LLHYLALIVLILFGLAFGVFLSLWLFLEVLMATDNMLAATCTALTVIVCVVVAIALLLTVPTSIWR